MSYSMNPMAQRQTNQQMYSPYNTQGYGQTQMYPQNQGYGQNQRYQQAYGQNQMYPQNQAYGNNQNNQQNINQFSNKSSSHTMMAKGNSSTYTQGVNNIYESIKNNPNRQIIGFSTFKTWDPETSHSTKHSQGFVWDKDISAQGRHFLSGIQAMYGEYSMS